LVHRLLAGRDPFGKPHASPLDTYPAFAA